MIRTEVDPETLILPVTAALEAVEPTLVAERLLPLRRLVRDSAARSRFHAILLGSLAVIAGLLTAVGIYGLTAFIVGERVPELGIRRALGARAAQVIGVAMGEELMIAGFGLVAGAVGAPCSWSGCCSASCTASSRATRGGSPWRRRRCSPWRRWRRSFRLCVPCGRTR